MHRSPGGTPTDVVLAAQAGWTARVPRVVVVALVVVAALSGLAAVGSVFHGSQPVREFVDDYLFPAPANLGYAAFVLVLAAALARRKRVAYWILLIVLGLQLVLSAVAVLTLALAPAPQLAMRLPPWTPWTLAGTVLFTAAVLGVLAAASRQFYGRVQRASVPKALSVFVLLVAASVGVGHALVSVFPGSLATPADRLSWTVERVLGGAVTVDLTRQGHAPGWVNLVLGLFGVATMLATLAVMFRAQRTASELHADDERRVRELLAEHGERDSLGYFATRRDKAVLFSPSGKAAISYRVVAGVCLASGDPIGDPEAWPPVIDRWLAMCREFTWRPAVLGAGEQGAGLFAGGFGGPAARRRGGRGHRGHPRGPRDAAGAAGGAAAAARRVRGALPPARRRAGRGDGRGGAAGFGLAQHRRRTRLFHGAGPVGRCHRRRLRARRSARPARAGAGVVVPGPVGAARVVAGPHAARPRSGQRPGRAHGVHADRRGLPVRGAADLAELRGVPLGFRRGRPPRCRAGAQDLARAAAVLLPLVAAGVAVPGEREVPPAVGAAVRRLRRSARPGPGRPGRGPGRGVRAGSDPHPPARRGRRRARAAVAARGPLRWRGRAPAGAAVARAGAGAPAETRRAARRRRRTVPGGGAAGDGSRRAARAAHRARRGHAHRRAHRGRRARHAAARPRRDLLRHRARLHRNAAGGAVR